MGGVKLGPYLLGPNDTPENGIYAGDFMELSSALPEDSVDLIFTDPPYAPEFLRFYGELAEIGRRILAPQKFLFAYCGNAWLGDIITDMGRSLDYFWTICGYQPESNHIFQMRNIGCHWRPVVVFSKGKSRSPRFIPDLWATNRDKTYHEWGQGVKFPQKYIHKICELGDLVFDPFCGGGTIPAVCKMLGRKYLAFEIDPIVAEKARERVRNTNPPLFVLEPEQLELV